MDQEIVRVIDGLGRIVLPCEVRKAMNWEEKTPIEIQLNMANNEVVLKRSQIPCIFCGATENLLKYENRFICPKCRKEIGNL